MQTYNFVVSHPTCIIVFWRSAKIGPKITWPMQFGDNFQFNNAMSLRRRELLINDHPWFIGFTHLMVIYKTKKQDGNVKKTLRCSVTWKQATGYIIVQGKEMSIWKGSWFGFLFKCCYFDILTIKTAQRHIIDA